MTLRERVTFNECLERALLLWEGDDAFGLSLALVPLTAAWYRIAGAPVRNDARLERRTTDRRLTAMNLILLYTIAAAGLLMVVAFIFVAAAWIF